MYGKMIVSIDGKTLNDDDKKVISHPMTVGIILFTYNYGSNKTEELKKLIGDIQKVALEADKKNGMPIFVDHEGGHIQRFTRGFKPQVGNFSFGEMYDIAKTSDEKEFVLKITKATAKKSAEELLEYGLINLAPVLDLDEGNAVISGLYRSFHKDPNTVVEISQSYIDGLKEGGLSSTGKHFPGHGQNNGDSHLVCPEDNRSLDEIEKNDLLPFINLINQNKLQAIMPAHILYKKIDPDNVASMSKVWLKDILRDKYKFDGIVVSDGLDMKGTGELNDIEKITKAISFGDVALFCNQKSNKMLDILNEMLTLDENIIYMDEKTKQRYDNWSICSFNARCSLISENKEELNSDVNIKKNKKLQYT